MNNRFGRPQARKCQNSLQRSRRAVAGATAALCACVAVTVLTCAPAAASAPYSLAKEIGLASFVSDSFPAIKYSPDRKFLAVETYRGVLTANKTEAELRIYSMESLKAYASSPSSLTAPAPVWIIKEDAREGYVILGVKWLKNSDALSFLQSMPDGKKKLVYADVKSRELRDLSSTNQDVTAYDVVDRKHYAYAIRNWVPTMQSDFDRTGFHVVTAESYRDAIFPTSKYPRLNFLHERSVLWASSTGSAKPVIDPDTNEPVILFDEGEQSLHLSPNGRWLLTARAVNTVPAAWPDQFPALGQSGRKGIVAGKQDLNVGYGFSLTSQFVLLDLVAKGTTVLSNAPTPRSAGWWFTGTPVWNAAGNSLLLPSAFVKNPAAQSQGYATCVAEFDTEKRALRCVAKLTPQYSADGSPDPAASNVTSLAFDGENNAGIIVDYQNFVTGKTTTKRYKGTADGSWSEIPMISSKGASSGMQVKIDEAFDRPPKLYVSTLDGASGKLVWDPNPRISDMGFQKIEVIHWNDPSGHEATGGLFMPAGYRPGQRYPLVIQTHGFYDNVFQPAGGYTTGYAAQALASRGIMVLDTRCRYAQPQTPAEVACQIATYESGIKYLADRGMIDASNVGIIGFSRTCSYVLAALAKSTIRFKAALITDGVDDGYWQYLQTVDEGQNSVGRDAEDIIGDRPFGSGLATWIKSSPGFNMDKITAPLQIVAEGSPSLSGEWGTYAALRYLEKPTDLILLDSDEHVLTNPRERLISQTDSVDWFGFWLKDYEDPDPLKASQYARWRELRRKKEEDHR